MTPEGLIKARINKLIAEYPHVYKFMPVPSGFGPSSLDYLLCVRGRFIAIEAKKPGGRVTPRQKGCIKQIHDAGGVALVIDGDEGLKTLKYYLDWFTSDAFPSPPIPEA